MVKYNIRVERNHPNHLGSNKVGAKVKTCRYCQGVLGYEEEINWDVVEKLRALEVKTEDFVIYSISLGIIVTYLLSKKNPSATKELAEFYFQEIKQLFKKYEEN